MRKTVDVKIMIYDYLKWSNNKTCFSYGGKILEIIKFCKPGIKARIDYLEWNRNDKI